MLNEMEDIFENANKNFLSNNTILFTQRVSERTLCGSLMLELNNVIKKTCYCEYFVDVEYNRNKGGKLKTIINSSLNVVKINCDLIVHSRGMNTQQDNLIAIEMKKSNRLKKDKESDKERLICLTKDSFDDVWSFDGKSLPEHVCRYVLGIYYEINYNKKNIKLEYYSKGNKYKENIISL